MKKLKIILLILVLSFLLCSCETQTPSIEDYEWKMRTVMRGGDEVTANGDTDDFIVCVGEADELYPEAKIIDLTLKAENGIVTVEDLTNGKTYTGTYKAAAKTPRGTDYEIVIDGVSGYAAAAPTEHYGGEAVPTLPINLGEYSLYFIPNK